MQQRVSAEFIRLRKCVLTAITTENSLDFNG
jgi:hypothetical protein